MVVIKDIISIFFIIIVIIQYIIFVIKVHI